MDTSKGIQRHPGHAHEDAFDSGYLAVSDIHRIFYEQYGNQYGKPVLFVHGGPGGSTSKANTKFFDPEIYRVVLFDQRGAGKSLPTAELRDNTSQLLVEDIEKIRLHLGIPTWSLVFGGSWGSTLSLLYAQCHPQAVGSLVLRGICTVRKSELDWSRRGGGASRIYPDAYEDFVNHLPTEERSDTVRGYYKLLTSDDHAVRVAAARAWNTWDMTLGTLEPTSAAFAKVDNEEWSLTHARLEAHYFTNGAWLADGQLLDPEALSRVSHIPLTIVQGRFDVICPPQTAWDLHKRWPGSDLIFVPGAGHSASEPGIQDKLIAVCDNYARRA